MCHLECAKVGMPINSQIDSHICSKNWCHLVDAIWKITGLVCRMNLFLGIIFFSTNRQPRANPMWRAIANKRKQMRDFQWRAELTALIYCSVKMFMPAELLCTHIFISLKSHYYWLHMEVNPFLLSDAPQNRLPKEPVFLSFPRSANG